jgi:hypothetical protein
MALRGFQSPQESVAIRRAVFKTIGQQLQTLFPADLDHPVDDRLAATLREIEHHETHRTPARDTSARDTLADQTRVDQTRADRPRGDGQPNTAPLPASSKE